VILKTNIVLPLKEPERAKTRLTLVLDKAARAKLVMTLFQQNIERLKEFFPEHNILVVTPSERVAKLARAYNLDVLKERYPRGLAAAIEAATNWSLTHGFASQLVLSPDIAHLDVGELTQLLEHARPNPSVLLCAAKDNGTNAILTTPPDAIDFWFGVNSLPAYQRRALALNLFCQTLNLEHMSFDVDTPVDMEKLIAAPSGARLQNLIEGWKRP
jgi:2-phospho-L-lactate guanylyltransferase